MLNKTRSSFVVALVLSLVGCAVPLKGPSHEEVVKQALPEVLEPGLEWSQLDAQGPVENSWLATFEDEKLEKLIDEVLQNNPELAFARANLESAASVAHQAGAQLLPDVNVGVGAQSTTRGSNTSTGTGVSLNVQWELDLWGKLQASSIAAEEAFRATEADFEFTRQSLVAQTAKAWYSAIEAKIQEHLAEHAVKVYQNLLYIVRVQVEVGQAQQQDVYLVKADLANAKERQKKAMGTIDLRVRNIEILLGRYPGAELEVPRVFVAMPHSVPTGLPVELLERRPDVRAAERQVAVAFQRIQVAKAAKLPSITLTGSGGRSSNELIDLIGASKGFLSLGSSLLAPLDIGGALQTQVEIETAQQKAALATYGSIALRAFNEVESALSNDLLLKEREALLASAVKYSRSALRASNTQYKIGQVDLFSVLQMQQRSINAKIALTGLMNARLAQRIDLHLALGGS
ncbi:MAG: TolC family protein, partial [Pseudomonadales bacterium]|nr:TolC family protein [Pseudomonadales bacterium]